MTVHEIANIDALVGSPVADLQIRDAKYVIIFSLEEYDKIFEQLRILLPEWPKGVKLSPAFIILEHL